jgi:hypothetical protein
MVVAISAIFLAPWRLAAQEDRIAQGKIVGTAVSSFDGRPIPFVLASLPSLDLRVFGAAEGGFELSGIPEGEYVLRVEQIGYSTAEVRVSVPQPDSASDLRVVLEPRPLVVEGLEVTAAPTECAVPGFRDAAREDRSRLAIIYDELRKTLERQLLLKSKYPYIGRWERTERFLKSDGGIRGERRETVTDTVGIDDWSYSVGNVLVPDPNNKRFGWKFRMPQVEDMADDEFLRSHCFRYAGTDTVAGAERYQIDFVPTREVTVTDVEGSFYLDARTLVLQNAVVRAVNLPDSLWATSATIHAVYREVYPSLVMVQSRTVSQQLRKDVFNVPIAAYVVLDRLLDYSFVDDDPRGPTIH